MRFEFLLIYFKDSLEYNRELEKCHQRSANRILDCCLHNGGIYIKMGQGLTSMNHLLPKDYIQVLSRLHNSALHREYGEVYF